MISGASKDGNAEEKQSTALTKSSCDTDAIGHDTPEWLGARSVVVLMVGIANLDQPLHWWGGRRLSGTMKDEDLERRKIRQEGGG